MRTRLLVTACACAISAVPAGADRAARSVQPAEVVTVYATVTDDRGHGVTDLQQADFEIREQDRIRPIVAFSTAPKSTSIVLMLDTSGSMTLLLDRVRADATHLIGELVPAAQMKIGWFNDKIEMSRMFTRRQDELTGHLSRDLTTGSTTPLLEAVMIGMNGLAGEAGRRIVLLLTDGFDDRSRVSTGAVNRRAAAEGVEISALVYDPLLPRGLVIREDNLLQKVVDESGGALVRDRRTTSPQTALDSLVSQLATPYELTFAPAAPDGKLHDLDVRVSRKGVRVHAPRKFQAGAGK